MPPAYPPRPPGAPLPPQPPRARGGLGWPLLLNLLVMVPLGALAQAQVHPAESFFGLLLGLLAADILACLVLLFIRPRWAAGFALATLLVGLVGLGTCGYSLSHMHVN